MTRPNATRLPVLSNLDRLRHLRRVERIAATCGRLDAAGDLSRTRLLYLYRAQYTAAGGGCGQLDIDEATFDGLDEGRTNAKSPDP